MCYTRTVVHWHRDRDSNRDRERLLSPALQCSVSSMELSCTGLCRVKCPDVYQVVPVAVGFVEGCRLECASMDTPPESCSLGPNGEGVQGAGRHLSQEQTRTCQAGRARWATLFSDTLAGNLLTKASTSSLPSTEQPRVKQEAVPAQGWAWKPQLSNAKLFPSLFSHRVPPCRQKDSPAGGCPRPWA